MRARFVMFATAVAVLALAFQALPQAVAQNANKAGGSAKKQKPAATKPAPPAPAPAQAAPGQMAAKKPAQRPKKKAAMKGIPSGVANCLKRLSDLAAKDPLIAYEGQPEQIINNGLLWNDPKSKCSVGSDDNMRKKVADLGKAWRMKDAGTVRSLIQELQGMAH